MLSTTLSALNLMSLMSERRIFFDGFHLHDANRREPNPGRVKRGQGQKYSGDLICKLAAERGCGCPYNKRRRATTKIGGAA